MLPTYVLSMDEDRLRTTLAELEAHGISGEHFPATRGDDGSLRERDGVTAFARHLCPDKTVAIALSHRAIADRFLASTAAPWCLVLEDDAVPAPRENLLAELADCVREHADKDYVRLFCQGWCSDSVPLLHGSSAAYLLSRSGAAKLRDLPVFWHVDLQLNAPHFRGALRPLFGTRDAAGCALGQTWRFWATQPYLKVPGLGALDAGTCLGAGAALAATAALCFGLRSNSFWCVAGLLLSLPLFAQLLSPARIGLAETGAGACVALFLLAASQRCVVLRPLAWLAAWTAVLALSCASREPDRARREAGKEAWTP